MSPLAMSSIYADVFIGTWCGSILYRDISPISSCTLVTNICERIRFWNALCDGVNQLFGSCVISGRLLFYRQLNKYYRDTYNRNVLYLFALILLSSSFLFVMFLNNLLFKYWNALGYGCETRKRSLRNTFVRAPSITIIVLTKGLSLVWTQPGFTRKIQS